MATAETGGKDSLLQRPGQEMVAWTTTVAVEMERSEWIYNIIWRWNDGE